MAEYYRTRFTIEGAVEGSELRGVALLEAAAVVAHEWAGDRFGEALGSEAGNYKAANGATAHIDRERLEESGFWGLALEHPDGDRDGVRWRSDFRLATEGGGVDAEIDVSVRRVGGAPDSSDSLGNASYPNALATLFRKFVCKSAGETLTIRAKRVSANDAVAFMKDAIFGSDRLMPLVAVSERWGRVLVDPDYLQWRLLGLATVATYDDAASRAMRERLGDSPLGCWGGYIRAYRPGCLPSDDLPRTPWRNRYWTWQEMINVMRQDPEDLLRDIGDECLGLALPRPRPRLYEEVSSRIRRVRYERLLERAEGASTGVAEYKALWDYADDVARENDALRKTRDELLDQIDDLKLQLLDKEAAVRELTKSRQHSETDASDSDIGDAGELRTKFGSVYAMVEYAAGKLAHLRFVPNAFKTAKSNKTIQFDTRADEIFEALETLNECAMQRAQSESLQGKGVQQWLKENGVDSSDESEATKNQFRSERTFSDPVVSDFWFMPYHIKMFGDDIRIHVRWLHEEGRFLVGHIGKHLRTVRDPT